MMNLKSLTLFTSLLFLNVESSSAELLVIPSPKEVTLNKGDAALSRSSRIIYSDDQAKPVAMVLSDDIKRLFKWELKISKGSRGRKGDVVLLLDKKSGLDSEEYYLKADSLIGIQAAEIGGLHAGTATLIQALRAKNGRVEMPALSIKDKPSREFRSLMLDVKNQWHSVDDIKKFIDMCRWYKVRYLSLHTGEDQWIGALTMQTGKMSAKERQEHRLYSKEEMDEIIAYGSQRGVYLLPHNECTPGFNHMKNAMKKDYNPSDKFAGFADELDGKGAFSDFEGKADDRWLKLMDICVDKSIDQFAAGYPDGKLPYYHVGPILGEGGMSPQLGLQILKMIEKKSAHTRMMFWNGINAKDASLYPHREKCVIAYYDDEFGASNMNSYLEEGWSVVNAAWSPLYVVGSKIARPAESLYNDWNLMRQGSDGIPGGYGAVTWEFVSEEKLGDGILGGMLATWETPLIYHLERVRVRVPGMTEHSWNHKAWPYPKNSYNKFQSRLVYSNRNLSRYLGEVDEKPLVPVFLEASEGTSKGKVKLVWRNGGGGSPLGFRVMRSEEKNMAGAKQISSDLPVTVENFVDASVENSKKYFYSVVAFNDAGESPSSDAVAGSAGTGLSNINSYESFDYAGNDKGDEGVGWTSPWNFEKHGSGCKFNEEGLTYKGLETSGGSLRMHPATEKMGTSITRKMTGKIGLDETTMWMSYLIRPSKVGIGDVFVVPNVKEPGAIGKVWGDNFSIYMTKSGVKMKADETYLVVARYDFGDGDKIALWVNPALDKEPKLENAVQKITAEIGSGDTIRLQMQGHGMGDYLLDELRFGTSWQSVGGLVNQNDKTSPNPSPMTWIGPPSLQKDGSVFMQAVSAEDPSGVEFLFECVETKKTSGWQTEPSYIVTGLKSGTYSYRVKARDKSSNRNEAEWSFAGKVTVK